MADNERDNPGFLLPPPLTYLTRSVARALGWLLLANGMLLNGWFNFTMRRTDTPINPRKPVSKLVTDGPFHYTRNPAYLSLALIYAGVAVLRNALWAILFLPVVLYVIRRDQIEREEQYLENVFGEED